MIHNSEIGYYINVNKYQLATKLSSMISDNATERYFEDNEEIFKLAEQDLTKLFTSIISERPNIFTKYIDWKKSVYLSRKIPLSEIKKHLDYLTYITENILPAPYSLTVLEYLEQALMKLERKLSKKSYIRDDSPKYETAQKYIGFILSGNKLEAKKIIEKEFSNGAGIEAIYAEILQPVQYEIGRLWETNVITVAEEHYATETTLEVMNKLNAVIDFPDVNGRSVLTAGIGDETHVIGIRFVNDLLKMNNWKTYYLGIGSPNSEIIKFTRKFSPDVVALSVTMDVYLMKLKKLIADLKDETDNKIKIIVGGSAFNNDQSLVDFVEADYYAESAKEAVKVLNENIE